MITSAVTIEVQTLLRAIKEVEFGEIFSVKPDLSGPRRQVQLDRNEKDLVDLLESHNKIDVLTIHQGKPVLAEIDEIKDGFRCRKKIKIPTG